MENQMKSKLVTEETVERCRQTRIKTKVDFVFPIRMRGQRRNLNKKLYSFVKLSSFWQKSFLLSFLRFNNREKKEEEGRRESSDLGLSDEFFGRGCSVSTRFDSIWLWLMTKVLIEFTLRKRIFFWRNSFTLLLKYQREPFLLQVFDKGLMNAVGLIN